MLLFATVAGAPAQDLPAALLGGEGDAPAPPSRTAAVESTLPRAETPEQGDLLDPAARRE